MLYLGTWEPGFTFQFRLIHSMTVESHVSSLGLSCSSYAFHVLPHRPWRNYCERWWGNPYKILLAMKATTVSRTDGMLDMQYTLFYPLLVYQMLWNFSQPNILSSPAKPFPPALSLVILNLVDSKFTYSRSLSFKITQGLYHLLKFSVPWFLHLLNEDMVEGCCGEDYIHVKQGLIYTVLSKGSVLLM